MQKNAYYPTVANLYIYIDSPQICWYPEIPLEVHHIWLKCFDRVWGVSIHQMLMGLTCAWFPLPQKSPPSPMLPDFFPTLGLLSTHALSSCFPVLSKGTTACTCFEGGGGSSSFPKFILSTKQGQRFFLRFSLVILVYPVMLESNCLFLTPTFNSSPQWKGLSVDICLGTCIMFIK